MWLVFCHKQAVKQIRTHIGQWHPFGLTLLCSPNFLPGTLYHRWSRNYWFSFRGTHIVSREAGAYTYSSNSKYKKIWLETPFWLLTSRTRRDSPGVTAKQALENGKACCIIDKKNQEQIDESLSASPDPLSLHLVH